MSKTHSTFALKKISYDYLLSAFLLPYRIKIVGKKKYCINNVKIIVREYVGTSFEFIKKETRMTKMDFPLKFVFRNFTLSRIKTQESLNYSLFF